MFVVVLNSHRPTCKKNFSMLHASIATWEPIAPFPGTYLMYDLFSKGEEGVVEVKRVWALSGVEEWVMDRSQLPYTTIEHTCVEQGGKTFLEWASTAFPYALPPGVSLFAMCRGRDLLRVQLHVSQHGQYFGQFGVPWSTHVMYKQPEIANKATKRAMSWVLSLGGVVKGTWLHSIVSEWRDACPDAWDATPPPSPTLRAVPPPSPEPASAMAKRALPSTLSKKQKKHVSWVDVVRAQEEVPVQAECAKRVASFRAESRPIPIPAPAAAKGR